VLAIMLAIRAVDPGFVEDTRLHGFDAAQRLWPRGGAADPVLIVAIDEESLAAKGQWPWPRTLIADLVRRIAAGRPDVLGIDILFAEPDRFSPQLIAESLPGLAPEAAAALARLPASDALLGEAIGTVPAVLVTDPSQEAVPGHAEPRRVTAPVREQAGDPRPFLFRYGSLIQTRPEITRGAVAEGAAAVVPDRDGIVRRLPLVVFAEGRLVPGFAAEVVAVAREQPSVVVTTGVHGVERVAAADVVAPTDARGQAILNFAPSELRYFAAADVLDPAFDAAQFAGHVVLLGVTGLGLIDQKQTPLGLMEGVQIHAQLIDAMRSGSLLQRPPIVWWIELVIILLAGAAAIGLVGYGRPLVAGATALGFVALLIGGEFALFRIAGWLVDGTYAGATVLATFGVMLTEHLRAAQAVRRRLDAELAQQRERNARLAGELDAARAIQMGLLPRRFPAFTDRDDVDLFAFIEPAREVGGDLFVFLLIEENRLFFMIGDVSGKGIGAALFMAMTREVVHDAARRHGTALDEVLGEANNKIAAASAGMAQEGGDLMFVTAFAGVLDLASGEVVFASAGHDAPFLVRPGAAPRRLDTAGGPPLGVVEEFVFPLDRDRMDVGEVLVLYTDGVTEAMNGARSLYGTERLTAVLAATSADNARRVIEVVTDDVRAFAAGAEQADDIALLAFRRTGPARV
jgi:serine phosphatase RsbU (regulator of sigma subunit)/CHASE2 domain-containing sensor protein